MFFLRHFQFNAIFSGDFYVKGHQNIERSLAIEGVMSTHNGYTINYLEAVNDCENRNTFASYDLVVRGLAAVNDVSGHGA
jgi:hypothetical protein